MREVSTVTVTLVVMSRVSKCAIAPEPEGITPSFQLLGLLQVPEAFEIQFPGGGGGPPSGTAARAEDHESEAPDEIKGVKEFCELVEIVALESVGEIQASDVEFRDEPGRSSRHELAG